MILDSAATDAHAHIQAYHNVMVTHAHEQIGNQETRRFNTTEERKTREEGKQRHQLRCCAAGGPGLC